MPTHISHGTFSQVTETTFTSLTITGKTCLAGSTLLVCVALPRIAPEIGDVRFTVSRAGQTSDIYELTQFDGGCAIIPLYDIPAGSQDIVIQGDIAIGSISGFIAEIRGVGPTPLVQYYAPFSYPDPQTSYGYNFNISPDPSPGLPAIVVAAAHLEHFDTDDHGVWASPTVDSVSIALPGGYASYLAEGVIETTSDATPLVRREGFDSCIVTLPAIMLKGTEASVTGSSTYTYGFIAGFGPRDTAHTDVERQAYRTRRRGPEQP